MFEVLFSKFMQQIIMVIIRTRVIIITTIKIIITTTFTIITFNIISLISLF